MFRALQTIAHTSHVHGKDLCHIIRGGGGAAVSYFLKYSYMLVYPACKGNILVL